MALIIVNNATISYEGVPAVTDVSFHVDKGDYLVILGENGSGKSSIVRALLGLVKLKSGSIAFSDGLKRDQIGYLPQQTPVQRDFPASVEEVVYSGLTSRMSNPFFLAKSEKSRADDNMRLLDIYEMRKKSYRSLSGGQMQRTLLARALCATDSLLLLDEPVNGLDPQASNEMYDIIRLLNERGAAIVTVSHDVHGALRDAKHVLIMDRRESRFITIDDYLKDGVRA